MEQHEQIYVGGQWCRARGEGIAEVDEAATGVVIGSTPACGLEDVEAAVAAAAAALPGWSRSTVESRAGVLTGIADRLEEQAEPLAELMTREVGTTIATSRRVQVDLAIAVFRSMADLVLSYPFQEQLGGATVLHVPKGVVVAITPWNYPLYQVAAKVAPAIAAGCTTVLKPSSLAPLAAYRLVAAAHDAGLPAGVLNLVTGPGAEVGELLVRHPHVDMVSLTGSLRAGRRVGELAARDIKRVTLELGGKSAFILLEGAQVVPAVETLLGSALLNNGQTCSATTRLVLPRSMLAEVEAVLAERVGSLAVGDPLDPATAVGPVVSAAQRDSIEAHLRVGVTEGTVLVGGPGGYPDHAGYFVRPTVVSRLTNDAHLSREEVFGPVLSVIPVADTDEAVRVANDSDFGLSGAVWGPDPVEAEAVARRLRTGRVSVNGGKSNVLSPFGGFRKSGIGRELGPHGLAEYLELMALHLPVDP